jgi:outer membrane lipoprotein-sorting protein
MGFGAWITDRIQLHGSEGWIVRMKRCKLCQPIAIPLVFLMLLSISANAADLADALAVLKRMESTYETVKDYRVRVQVIFTAENAAKRTEEFIYTFKKPRQVRIDFQMPQPGTILIFPDEEGKVLVRPWGWRFLDLRLAPDSLFLSNPSGQRIDQTDFGLLIRNIGRSMDGGRRGPLEILEEDQYVRIRVLAENHFHDSKVTRYRFTIDKNTCFPTEIEEWTPEGVLERRITFRDLAVNTGVPDSFFRLDGDEKVRGVDK